MGLQEAISSNKAKSIALITCFPVLLFSLCCFFCFFIEYDAINPLQKSINISLIISIIITIISIIALCYQKKIIFKATRAKELSRKDNPEIYNLVENLCISKGMKTPKIGIIYSTGMNAFATGRSENDSWIVFTTGLLKKLENREIEAVAGHELTHILNKDCRLMAIIVVYIGIVATIGEIIIRVLRNKDSGKNKLLGIISMLGLVCCLLGYIFYPLIRFSISRKREYLADAGSVEITHDKMAMISALKKISANSNVSSIQERGISAMCIESTCQKKKKKAIFKPNCHSPIHRR